MVISSFPLIPKSSFLLRSAFLFNSISTTINRPACFPSNIRHYRRGTITPLGYSTSSLASVSSMAVASFKPEEARIPSVVPLPTPSITKVSIYLISVATFCFLCFYFCLYFWFVCSLRLGYVNYRLPLIRKGIYSMRGRQLRRLLRRELNS